MKNLNQKNPLLLEPGSTWGYFLNYVIDKRKPLDTWKTIVVLAITQEPIYAANDRDVNIMYDLITNSFQEIVHNWYAGISLNIRSLIELDVKEIY